MNHNPSTPYILLIVPAFFILPAIATDPVVSIYTNVSLLAFGLTIILAFYTSRQLRKGQKRFYLNVYLTAVYVVTSLFCLAIGLKGNPDTFTQSLLWGTWLIAFILIFLGEKFIPFLKSPRKQGLALVGLLIFVSLMMIPTGLGIGTIHNDDPLPIVRLLGEKQGNEIITFLLGVTTSLMFLTIGQLTRKSQNGDWNSFKENHKKKKIYKYLFKTISYFH